MLYHLSDVVITDYAIFSPILFKMSVTSNEKISNDLQKLLKYFSGAAILHFFNTP